MGRKKAYRGSAITVYFEARRCIHSRNCVLGLPGVFRADYKGDWIVPGNAPAELLASVIRTCPSGALTYKRHDGGLEEPLPEVNTARTLENGPLAFRADLRIEGEGPRTRAVLCRCGASKEKPFCDNTHGDTGFRATGEPDTLDSEPLDERGGPLRITPTKDGPLRIEGNLEVCSGTGRRVMRTTEAELCRCGGSKEKPFCDGTHEKNGFTSD